MLTEILDASLTSSNPNSESASSFSASSSTTSLDASKTSLRRDVQARNAVIKENPIKSMFGIPGTKPSASITREVGSHAADKLTCRDMCSDIFSDDETRVTIIAVAIDSRSEGI